MLFDVQQRSNIAELSTPFIKYVVWSADMSAVALLSKHAIIIANKKLGNSCTGEGPCQLLLLAYSALTACQTYEPFPGQCLHEAVRLKPSQMSHQLLLWQPSGGLWKRLCTCAAVLL